MSCDITRQQRMREVPRERPASFLQHTRNFKPPASEEAPGRVASLKSRASFNL
ncbi:predicted protein [Plenodomus lingam JN3]|uniref:Predicted protein n=1 Tax=Leptosphaeria maculans (strain JN3 / isolate v23.1.3 / race Av1-4-5-6-7-8) TaxID=985895 RepID=E4ZYP7_LEPMJ|nr:predicted protein [Plenodomus lingam JN3]CBX96573.1 predicted protein [Plenodomus lingam JN3]